MLIQNIIKFMCATPSFPTVVSAATNTAGTQITITFSKDMIDPAGKQSQFSVGV